MYIALSKMFETEGINFIDIVFMLFIVLDCVTLVLLFAFIEGGYQRTSKLSNGYVKLDALTSSFDVGLGYGGNDNLNFTWSCNG
jgi:hypothetical protein